MKSSLMLCWFIIDELLGKIWIRRLLAVNITIKLLVQSNYIFMYFISCKLYLHVIVPTLFWLILLVG